MGRLEMACAPPPRTLTAGVLLCACALPLLAAWLAGRALAAIRARRRLALDRRAWADATALRRWEVRALAEAIAAPPLLPAQLPSLAPEALGGGRKWPATLAWLQTLDAQGADSSFALEAQSARSLGSLFEVCLKYAILHNPAVAARHKRAAFRIQVHDDGRTLGELDVVLLRRGSADAFEHYEMSCKVFLALGSHEAVPTHLATREVAGPTALLRCPHAARVIGPHQRERLIDAAGRVHRQVAFGAFCAAVGAARKALGAPVARCARSRAILKGYVMVPVDDFVQGKFAGLGGRGGWWIHRTGAARLEELLLVSHRPRRFVILPSTASWLAPVVHNGDESAWPFECDLHANGASLHAALCAIAAAAHGRSDDRRSERGRTEQANRKLVAVLRPHASGGWVEESRGFVVEDGWPRHGAPSPQRSPSPPPRLHRRPAPDAPSRCL